MQQRLPCFEAMEEESGVDKSLFRLVDASDVEATVLRDAEKRARDATIPVFTVARGLGFGAASLGKFCADVDPLILRMAADATRHEGQQLRENGVANLATRDKASAYSSCFLPCATVYNTPRLDKLRTQTALIPPAVRCVKTFRHPRPLGREMFHSSR